MGVGFVVLALAAWHAILVTGRGTRRGAVWALTVAPRSAAFASARGTRAMGIGFAAIAVAAWHAILAIGSAIQRGAVWALVVALKASAACWLTSARALGIGFVVLGLAAWHAILAFGQRDPAGRYLVRDRRACKGGRRRRPREPRPVGWPAVR